MESTDNSGSLDGISELALAALDYLYSELKQVGEPEAKRTNEAGRSQMAQFSERLEWKLWFEGDGGTNCYPVSCGGVFIHPLGTERVLVTVGRQFSLFARMGTSLDRKFHARGVKFALCPRTITGLRLPSIVGVGDRVISKRENHCVRCRYWQGHCRGAVRAAARTQSWAALSPDGTLLAWAPEHFATVSFAVGIAEVSPGESFSLLRTISGSLTRRLRAFRHEHCHLG